jgi:large subunit ribosomal protein L25
MQTQVIEVKRRDVGGKGLARKVRQNGMIPGVLYGHKQEPVALTVDSNELRKRVKASGMGRNTIFKVAGLGRDIMALLKDVQIDPLKRNPIHVDFVEIRETDRIVVEVPVELEGKPAGVIAGGVLQAVRRTIAVECSPLAIPQKITADVSHLNMNQALHVSDIKFPEGTKSGYPAGTNFAIATVQVPCAEEEVKLAVAEGAVEGAVAAEGAAAEGAAAPAAAPAAEEPAKKGKGDKK